MSEPTQEEVISIVSSIFKVGDVDLTLESLRFQVLDEDFKSKFVSLSQRLEKMNLVCRLHKSPQGIFISIVRLPPRKVRKWLSAPWTPRVLFAAVVGLVMVDGYFRTIGVNQLVNIGDPVEIAGIYTLSLLGILGIHESGHLVVSKLHKLKTSWPFFIPGIPVYGIPTFGAIIFSRGLTVNRHILFDVAIAGPIAGLIIAVIVAMYGAAFAPVITEDIADELFQNGELLQMNEPILMKAALSVFGKGGEGQEVIMTPVLWAAWLGFLITFLNLLPAWQLDGGHMARSLFGMKIHRIGTFASIGILFLLGYWIMGLFILVLSSRNPGAMPLDDVSPVPKNRRLLYVLVVVLAVLCAPLPPGILS